MPIKAVLFRTVLFIILALVPICVCVFVCVHVSLDNELNFHS